MLEAAAGPMARQANPGQVALVGLAPASAGLRINGVDKPSTQLNVVVTTAEVESADTLNPTSASASAASSTPGSTHAADQT